MNRATIVSLLLAAAGATAMAAGTQSAPPTHSTGVPAKLMPPARPKPAPKKPATVLGMLGVTLRATAIHVSPDPKSAVFFRPGRDQYLVLRRTQDPAWCKVLLNDGSFGYVLAMSVLELPKDVVWHGDGGNDVLGSLSVQYRVARAARKLVGTNYKLGGEDPGHGFDAAGFVQYLWRSTGRTLPHTVEAQAKIGRTIERLEELKPGDRLYFWSAKRGAIDRTGIFVGRGYFVHCDRKKGVTMDYLSTKWRKSLVAARR